MTHQSANALVKKFVDAKILEESPDSAEPVYFYFLSTLKF